MRIAVCQYQLEVLHDWITYQLKIDKLAQIAQQGGTQLLMLLEYAGIEIAYAWLQFHV